MYYNQSPLSQDDFDDDDGGVLYRHFDPRSSLTLPTATARPLHATSRPTYPPRRTRATSPARSGSRWDARAQPASSVSAFAAPMQQPPPTSLFALPARRVRPLEDMEDEDEEERRLDDGQGEEERKDGHEEREDDEDVTVYGSQQRQRSDHRSALPSRPSLFSSSDASYGGSAVHGRPLPEDDSKWDVADEATARLLQQAKVRQERSDEDFFWSDPVVVKEEGGQRAVGGRAHGATLTAATLTDRQRKERVYAQKLQNQQHKAKRANYGARQSNLAVLSARHKARATAVLELSEKQPASAPLRHGNFSAQLEADLGFKRQTGKSLDIEDADAPTPISEAALAAGRAMAVDRDQHSWKDQLDAQITASTPHSSITAHAQPQSHSRRGKKRGGLEEQLERVLRMRASLHARYTSEQERLRRASQPLDDGLTADAQGCVRAVVVKLVASIEHYSLLFTVGVLCSPYRVAESDGFAPAAGIQQLQTALPSLQRIARSLRVDVGRLALIVFNSQQRQAMHVPDKLSAPMYVRLTWPWFDVGERMGVFGHVLLDMFDCSVLDPQHGVKHERQEEERWEAEQGQRDADARLQMDMVENEGHDARGGVVVDDAELRKQQDALRATFGELTEAEVESLFADDEDDPKSLQRPTQTPTSTAPLPARRPFSSYRRLPLASVTPYSSLWFTCLVGIVRKVNLHGHSVTASDPNSRIIQHQLLPSLLLDDGTALVQVEVSMRCAERWAEVLLRGEGNVIWIGAARVNETPSVGLGLRDGLKQLMGEYGYKEARGLRMLRVDDQSRFVMKAQHEQTLLTVSHAPHRLTALLSLLTTATAKLPVRVHVHVKVVHVQWEHDDSCIAWVSDSSLMPSASNAAHPLPPTTAIIHFNYHLHIQQLRSFIYTGSDQSNSLLLRDLMVSPTSDRTWPVHLTADTFTELCSPRPTDGATVEGFEETVMFEQQRKQLRVITRADVLGSCNVSISEQLVPPFAPPPSRLSLSSLLTPTALHGYTASPLLQRYGLFDVEGVVMAVYPPAQLSRQCGECGQLAAYEGGGRRSGGSQLSAYCRRCHTQSGEPHTVVGRVWVDVQCSDIHMLHTVRVLLSSGEVSRCLQGRLAVDGVAASLQSLLQDDGVVREQLMSKRVQCVCRCEEVRDVTVRAEELQLVAMEPNKDLRARGL